jgi:hypothetical protein
MLNEVKIKSTGISRNKGLKTNKASRYYRVLLVFPLHGQYLHRHVVRLKGGLLQGNQTPI